MPFHSYCAGLLLPGDRKSVEPMAARMQPRRVQAAHQLLHHFVAKSDWSDDTVLAAVRSRVLPLIAKRGPIRALIIDDTGMPKKGLHSVGLGRQYCGHLVTQDNCQVAVSLSAANDHASLPIAYRLYLPRDWADDPERRAAAGVPGEISLSIGVAADGPVKRDTLGLARLVEDCNPTWDDAAAEGPTAGDAAFGEAAAMVEGVLRRRVESLRARYAAESEILAAYAQGADQRVLVLARGMPWKNVAFSLDLPVLFTISPASNGNWMVDTVPPEPGSFEQRLPLPERWAGLQNEALAAETGVADAVFVHLRRFVAAAKTLDGALSLTRLAMEDMGQRTLAGHTGEDRD